MVTPHLTYAYLGSSKNQIHVMCVPGTKIDDVLVLKYYSATLFSKSLELNDILYNKHTQIIFLRV